nr:tyrosine decarboxylase 1 [Tanacetum cinerariifolium]
MSNLEYRHGELVKKMVKVSDTEVDDSITIGEIHPRVTTVEEQRAVPGLDVIVGLSQQVQTLQTALHGAELQNQQLRTRVAEMESREGILMSYMLWMEERHTGNNPKFTKKMENGLNLKAMDSEQLREHGHKMVDFIADYYKSIENFPVLSQVEPGYLRKLLPDSAPVQPESLESVLGDVQTKILPGVTHWQSPDYFAYFPSNSSVAGFLGEMLSGGINMVGFSWITSPAATELEMIVLDWLANLLKLPSDFLSKGPGGGAIQGTASEALLVVLLAARDKVLREVGKDALGRLVVYGSDQTHSSLQKACQIAGIHPENCRLLRTYTCNEYALSPESLTDAISHDVASGLIPLFLCATIGTTSSTAVDPLLALGKITKRYGIWFHVDAAYAGSACICPEYRHHLNGVEEADSFNMNCHKWFLTNFDCSALWIKDRNALIQSLSTNPEFLKNKRRQKGQAGRAWAPGKMGAG